MLRKRIMRLSIILLIILITNSIINAETGKNLKKIRYGYQPGHSQITIARVMGFIEKEFSNDNIIFEFSIFPTGPAIIEAFAGARLDFGQVGDQPAIQARANDIDVKVIGVYSSSYAVFGLVASPESGIKTIHDLKNKKIGISVGSIGHQLLYLYLKAAAINPSDVKIVNLQPGDMNTSLATKNIDAAITWEPFLTIMQTSKAGTLIADGNGFKLNINVIIADNQFLKQNAEITSRLLKVLNKTEQWILANKEKAKEIIAKESGFSLAILTPMFNCVKLDMRLTSEAVQSIKETASFLKDNNIIRKEVNIDNLLDAAYLKAAGIQ